MPSHARRAFIVLMVVSVSGAIGVARAHAALPRGVLTFVRSTDGRWAAGDRGVPAPQAVIENYDNYRAEASQPPGDTVARGWVHTGGRELGDDLDLVAYQHDYILSAASWHMINLSSEDSLTGADFVLRWYRRSDMSLLGEEPVEFRAPFPIPPGFGLKLADLDGTLAHLAIPLDDEMYFSTQIVRTIGIDLSEAGQMYGGPANTGTSSRFVRDFDTGDQIDLGINPLNNMLLGVRTEPVPCPSAISVSVLGIMTAVARRRVS